MLLLLLLGSASSTVPTWVSSSLVQALLFVYYVGELVKQQSHKQTCVCLDTRNCSLFPSKVTVLH